MYDPTFAPDFDCIFVKTRYMKAKAWLILKAVKLWLAVALLWLIAAMLFVAHVAIGIIKLIFIITLFPLTWVVYVLDRNIYNRIKIQLEELRSFNSSLIFFSRSNALHVGHFSLQSHIINGFCICNHSK